jgi:adenylate kinase
MNLIFFGPQGVGKGTQAKTFSVQFGIPHISTGDVFRQNIADKTELGKKIEALINKGELVSDDITNDLIKDRLNEEDCKKGFILDGYPRNLSQAKYLDKLLKSKGSKIDLVIYLFAEYNRLLKRIAGRAKDEKRDDDNDNAVALRLQEFEKQTLPLVDYYEAIGNLKRVDGSGSITQVSTRIDTYLELTGLQ